MDDNLELPLPVVDPAGPPRAIPLPGGPFQLWPVGAIRGAGFPLAALVELGDPELAAAADRLNAARVEADGRKTTAVREARDAYDAAVEPAQRRQEDLLIAVAARPDFQEAVTWQNHKLLDAVVRGVSDAPRNRKLRQRLRVIARYWSRYCAKNDTIGFFGPVCWIGVDTGPAAVSVHTGPGVTRQREVFLESWAIDVLAAAVAANPLAKPWLAPRQNPTVYLDGDLLRHLAGPPFPLDPMTARLVRHCDGQRTARQVAADFVADPESPYTDEAQVFEVLDRLTGFQVLYWDCEPPMQMHAERTLRRSINQIGDPELRAAVLAPLDELVASRDRIAATSTVDELNAALTDIEQTFVRLTGQDPSQNAGQTYGGRELTYMDATRDLDLRIGQPVLDALGPPLSILALGARWMTAEIGKEYHQIFLDAYEKLAAEQGGTGPVDLVTMLFQQGASITDVGNRPLERAMAGMRTRFEELLGLGTDAHRVDLDSAELAPRAAEIFGNPLAGWAHAHIHNIDLQVAARSVDALRAGEFTLVLGEFHLAWNPLEGLLFSKFYPDQEYLGALMDSTYPQARVMLSPLKGFPRLTGRSIAGPFSPKDWWLSVGPHTDGPADKQMSLAEMVVVREGDELRARTRDGRAEFGLVDIGGIWGAWEIMDSFKLVSADRSHTPRVTLDRMVVCRETWTVPMAELSFVDTDDEASCFLAAREWLAKMGLPRFCFAKLSSEMKPFYVDFTSPVLVSSLASSVRAARDKEDHARTVSFSEMMPAPEDTWLPDAAGNVYTGELRLAVIDPVVD